ncbi:MULTISPECIES: RrF2 family transcriptional regulator [Croceimicrobium]|uniref:Rrf2 family transcriptional regulator n=1 Tax=Croceimicrobium hydrocarbonivorans TaxID=2761580 RepID=A0A7H0VHP5_9FLAO|nr:Rrf2 family transcriptional regulator [Croceimicrobium hydrocarbonivorans]QNR25243.1 Rrf2 family transcriptional regulator [Croceimicrobium hydrocarbonivorans]
MFSKACEYGIKAMIYIAQQDAGQRVGLKQIAQATDSPEAFTAKILQMLARNGVLVSFKGPSGGFSLPKDAGSVHLNQIVSAIDGDEIFTGCGLGLAQCDGNKPCPVHFKFASVRDGLSHMLHSTSLKELADGLDSGKVFLKQ